LGHDPDVIRRFDPAHRLEEQLVFTFCNNGSTLVILASRKRCTKAFDATLRRRQFAQRRSFRRDKILYVPPSPGATRDRQEIFEAVNEHRSANGVKIANGTSIDATIIEAGPHP